MQLNSTLTFSASCEAVAAMLVDPGFADHVGREINAENVTSTLIENGMTSVISVATPSVARTFLGATMTVTETVVWGEPAANGSRTGRMTLVVAGVPTKADGPLRLEPGPNGSTLTYEADFSVRIPLVGGKIEQVAHKHLTRIMGACQHVGETWLARSN